MRFQTTRRWLCGALLVTMSVISSGAATAQSASGSGGYGNLLTLFSEWRTFEQPPAREGAPDYTAETVARRGTELKKFQERLAAIKPEGWPVEQQVDYHLVRAEMNGMDFSIRVLKPWERDPAFYKSIWTEQSDTPAHEGPTHHRLVETWTYSYPLARAAEAKLASELHIVPPLLAQARLNLSGNAKDLWITGIGTMKQQIADLAELEKITAKSGGELKKAIQAGKKATEDFVAWLERQAPSKTGPSGVGKENYTWTLRNVHLVPMTWDDEVMLLKRELSRAHAALHLEEQRNRTLPPLKASANEEEYRQRGGQAVSKMMAFIKAKDLMPVKPSMDPAMRAQIGHFVPEETRNFFAIATHFEPLPLYSHFYHWWDLAQIRDEPHASPIRRGALLYNIWDSRAEGMATAFEEAVMQAGLYDDNPRGREVVWIMLAQRAARGLASLYSQANLFDVHQAKDFQVEWTPRGWMSPKLDLLNFEQQLYLRQPGYGTSYVTGKYLLDELMKDRAHQVGDAFTTSQYYAELNAAGVIPVSMIRWQMTGRDDEVRELMRAQ
jgi:hypothetical protein